MGLTENGWKFLRAAKDEKKGNYIIRYGRQGERHGMQWRLKARANAKNPPRLVADFDFADLVVRGVICPRYPSAYLRSTVLALGARCENVASILDV